MYIVSETNATGEDYQHEHQGRHRDGRQTGTRDHRATPARLRSLPPPPATARQTHRHHPGRPARPTDPARTRPAGPARTRPAGPAPGAPPGPPRTRSATTHRRSTRLTIEK